MKPATPDEDAVVSCVGVRKVFRTLRRRPGVSGVLRNFFRREAVEFVALDGIDLTLHRGELVGLIGVNGAGKTTLVKCLTGIIPVTSGRATLFAQNCFYLGDAQKRRLSLVMGQRSQLWWDLAPMDSFRLLAQIYDVPRDVYEGRVRAYAERLDVLDGLTVQLRHLSLGQRMKMEFIGAFLHDPEVVFLDEPTIGLDLLSRETIREFLRELNREKRATIVLTSHDMEDIEATCSRLLILEKGRLLYNGDLVGLKRRLLGRRSLEVHLEPGSPGWSPALQAELEPFGAALVLQAPLHLTFVVPVEKTQALVKRLLDLLSVRDLNVERQPLEHLIRDIFAGGAVAP